MRDCAEKDSGQFENRDECSYPGQCGSLLTPEKSPNSTQASGDQKVCESVIYRDVGFMDLEALALVIPEECLDPKTIAIIHTSFLECEALELCLVAPMGHGAAIEELAGILDTGDPGSGSGTILLFGKSISQDIFRQGLLPVPVVSGYVIPGMHAETAVMPGHESFR